MALDIRPYVVLAVQVDLAAVFLIAGLSKLRAPREFIAAVGEYRIVPRAASVVGPAVIASELFLFATYASGQLLLLASWLAAAWLSVFAVVTWINLRRGRPIACHCFGNSGEPIGARTLGRIGLIGTGVVLVALGRLWANVAPPAVLEVPALLATAGVAVFVALSSTWLLHARGLRAGPGAAPATPGELTGQPAPRFSALDVLGERVESTRYEGQPHLLVFVAPSCPACQALQGELDALPDARRATIVLICVARAQPCRQFAEQHAITRPILVDNEAILANTFGISVTPTAVFVDARNVVGQYQHPGRADDPSQTLQRMAAQLAILQVHSK
jgi:peroxiredoxin